MKLSVLNPGGNDPEQHFPDGAGVPTDQAHPPVNYHGFAACTGGGFFRKLSFLPSAADPVLVLIRRDLKAVRHAVTELRSSGRKIAIAWKEAGALQVAAQLRTASQVRLFREICERSDAAIATTPELGSFFRSAGVRRVEFIPTPYPVDDARWDFSLPQAERRGIFLGTREFDTPSRNHLAALLAIKPLAESMREPVTVFNVAGWSGRRMLRELRFSDGMLQVIEGKLPYPQYLRRMAQHKLVFQLDASAVPGQVAGDALLCGIPCVGGNGATERLAFPELCGHQRNAEQLFDLTARLLEHPPEAAAAAKAALSLASARLSFRSVARQLEQFLSP
ncbi:MAG TPA: hypothetical protein VF593_08290 [Chthoniobacteraceae bacterium]|jgi:hypothetical protein